jgi:hypothetical protein
MLCKKARDAKGVKSFPLQASGLKTQPVSALLHFVAVHVQPH